MKVALHFGYLFLSAFSFYEHPVVDMDIGIGPARSIQTVNGYPLLVVRQYVHSKLIDILRQGTAKDQSQAIRAAPRWQRLSVAGDVRRLLLVDQVLVQPRILLRLAVTEVCV